MALILFMMRGNLMFMFACNKNRMRIDRTVGAPHGPPPHYNYRGYILMFILFLFLLIHMPQASMSSDPLIKYAYLQCTTAQYKRRHRSAKISEGCGTTLPLDAAWGQRSRQERTKRSAPAELLLRRHRRVLRVKLVLRTVTNQHVMG